ncbi:MAG: hypothetical protein DRP35_10050 [Candidatus Zixiibacteriota bacterium]|nr:MAG: hypothetical protein DRP35_10050 [candidate division Zixibacteria bacterium]
MIQPNILIDRQPKVTLIYAMTGNYPTYNLNDNFDGKLSEFVDDIFQKGFNKFEKEFHNIDSFVCTVLNESGERGDHNLRLSSKKLYLLEAISFKIYDELNRDDFNKAKDTLIIMPDCLSVHNPECEKVETEYGDVCKRCKVTCPAHKIIELATKYKAKAIFSKRKLTEQIKYFSDKSGDMGVIGIACIMMLAMGMRTAQEISIPARGVLLNYTGCDHWNDKPFGSDFTISSLESILKEKQDARNKNT